MAFDAMTRPPASRNVLEIPTGDMSALVTIPPAELFEGEQDFWCQTAEVARGAGDDQIVEMARENSHILREVEVGAVAIHVAREADTYDPVKAGAWFLSALVSVGHARLAREVLEVSGHRPRVQRATPEDVQMFSDYNNRNYRDASRSGFHVTPGFMRQALGIEPPRPGRERYYEGEAIYMRARRPAEPTTTLVQYYRQVHGKDLDPKSLVSLVARPKLNYWTQQPE